MNLRHTVKAITLAAIFSEMSLTVAEAKVTPAPIFSDNMVLQQNAVVKFHGNATPDSRMTITVSWNSKNKIKTLADDTGAWSVELNTPAYGGPFEIAVTDNDGTVTLKNILIGDVWVCGGQSNMEMPVKGFRGQPAHGTHDLIMSAKSDRQLRLFKQERVWSTTPLDSAKGTWTELTPNTVGDFSVVGYVFGDYIQNVLDIPVGLIQCCWSNSKIEAWMAEETFRSQFPDIELPTVDQTKFGWLEGTPTLLYNGMVNAWDGFPVKGAVWYQGEANNHSPELYKQLFPAMVDDWQKIFRNDSMPFYYVQLAPFKAEGCQLTNYAEFRQAQAEMLSTMPNIGMATIGDCGDSIFIHPPKKVPVGKRLAYLALDGTYGRKCSNARPPVIDKVTYNPDDNSIILEWTNAADGLTPTRCDLPGFEIVDAFGEVYDAKAQVYADNKVRVISPVKNPVEVRYGFHNYYESSLFNNVGLPASPFRMAIPKGKKPAIMWFDSSANIKRFSNSDSIDYYIDKIADLGFTHAVVCIRPISGYLLYDSELAPKFRGKNDDIDVNFDYLGKFIEAGHRRGLTVLASMNTFCAGHNYLNKGLVYEGHPEWTSIVLDVDRGLIPITEQKNKYGAMINPVNPEYQEYILSVMKEILTKYPEVDGLMLDRVRYDGITADFSDLSRKEFEKYIGEKVRKFPDDILSLKKVGDNGRFEVVPGKHYKKWIEWRTKTITDFMARARDEVKSVRPEAIFSTYTGAWYPSYYEVGVNFASKDYDPSQDYDWATPEYKNYGYAELLDLYTTGNYYPDITIAENNAHNNIVWNETDSKGHRGSWYCVEGSCQRLRGILGNNDVLGGILVDQFYNDRDRLSRAIEMNLYASDGLMVFDIVHIIEKNLWKEVENGMRAGGNIR